MNNRLTPSTQELERITIRAYNTFYKKNQTNFKENRRIYMSQCIPYVRRILQEYRMDYLKRQRVQNKMEGR